MQKILNFIDKSVKLAEKLKGIQKFLKSLTEIGEQTNFEKPKVKIILDIETSTHEEDYNSEMVRTDLVVMKAKSPANYEKLVKCLLEIAADEATKTENELVVIFDNVQTITS